uniref:Uncharacterized protein n=1 Tax=Globodera rostochiensis TaxID=31243 RepID=A0A914HQP5_GLORO
MKIFCLQESRLPRKVKKVVFQENGDIIRIITPIANSSKHIKERLIVLIQVMAQNGILERDECLEQINDQSVNQPKSSQFSSRIDENTALLQS